MKLKKIALFSLVALMPFIVKADKYTTNVYIDSVEAHGNGNFWIIAKDSIPTSGCYSNGKLFKVFVSSTVSEQAVRNLLSVALAAQASGRSVDIYHDETQNCKVSKLKVNGLN